MVRTRATHAQPATADAAESPDGRARAEAALVASEERYLEALEATKSALARAQALYRVTSSQVAVESLHSLLQRVVDTMVETLTAWRVHMIAIDTDRRMIVGNYRGGLSAEQLLDIDFEELMEGLAGWTIAHGQATISPGGVRDPREADRVHERRAAYGHGSMMVAPMLYGPKAHGIIAVLKEPGEPDFDQSDLDLLSAMSRQAAVAIEGTQLREDLQAARDELEARVALRTTELAESEERYRRITETITDYVYTVVLDGDGRPTTNHGPGSVAVTGYSPEELASNNDLWLQMVVPDDCETVIGQVRDLTEDHAAAPVEHRIVRKDGVVRLVRSTLVPHLDSDRRLLGWDGLIQDVTERRVLEDQLLQAQKLQSIGRLAGGVAHDFNNLLTAILGNAELALGDLSADHPARDNVMEISKAAERAASLTKQLLAFARKQMIAPVPTDLSAAVGGSLGMLRRLLGEDVEITAVLDQGLGIVMADPGQVQQLLINLTVNARDAMPNGGRLVIETANETVGDEYRSVHPEVGPARYVTLAVTDTGTGMTPEVLAHVFEPFFTTKGLGEGTGLGLATCHGIVKQSGGHIWVHSEQGHGTTVTILLPTVDQASVTRTVSESLPPPTGTESVLVVEDDEGVRRLAVLGLRSHGYAVSEASNAAEALDLAAVADRLDLVVSDVIMPGMRGPALAARLRQLRPNTKLLLVSGHADTDDSFRDADGRMWEMLPKPFTPERLARKVREILDAQQ